MWVSVMNLSTKSSELFFCDIVIMWNKLKYPNYDPSKNVIRPAVIGAEDIADLVLRDAVKVKKGKGKGGFLWALPALVSGVMSLFGKGGGFAVGGLAVGGSKKKQKKQNYDDRLDESLATLGSGVKMKKQDMVDRVHESLGSLGTHWNKPKKTKRAGKPNPRAQALAHWAKAHGKTLRDAMIHFKGMALEQVLKEARGGKRGGRKGGMPVGGAGVEKVVRDLLSKM